MMEAFKQWLLAATLPVTLIGIIALGIRMFMPRANAARRTIVGYAALAAMAFALLTPWLPKFISVAPEATAPIIRVRDRVSEIVQTGSTSPVPEDHGWRPNIAFAINAGYLAIAGLLLLRLAVGMGKVRWLKSTAKASEFSGNYPILLHDQVSIPLALDGRKPCIVLPMAAKTWSDEMRQSVILHEEAHLKHRDGWWLFLGQALSITFWFNPVVWMVERRLRRDIEFLADDEVVLAGIQPASYAQNMLEVAKSARQGRYVLATAFAGKGGLKARVASVLNDQKGREKVGTKKLRFAILAAGAATIAAAGWQNGPWQRQANPTSWAPDVKAGLTTPGNATNGYTGVLKDGRKVEVVQVGMLSGKGMVGWRPNGDPIAPKELMYTGKAQGDTGGKYRYIVTKTEKLGKPVDMMVSLGSGNYGVDNPEWMSFSGGWMLKDDGSPYRYSVTLIGLKETGGSTGYFTATVTDSDWKLDRTVNPHKPFDPSEGPIENLQIKQVIEPQDKLREDWTKDNPGPFLEITWMRGAGRELDDIKPVADVWTPKGVVEKEMEGNYGGYKGQRFSNRYYLSGVTENLRELRWYSRVSQNVELNGIKLRPTDRP